MVKGILADNNVQGHLEILLRIWQSSEWREIWESLNVAIFSFEALGLNPDSPDVALWEECQKGEIVLLTANRNQKGPDSLETTIRKLTTPITLPVFTLADSNRIQTDSAYALGVAIKLLQYFLEIDSFRGTGRLFVP